MYRFAHYRRLHLALIEQTGLSRYRASLPFARLYCRGWYRRHVATYNVHSTCADWADYFIYLADIDCV